MAEKDPMIWFEPTTYGYGSGSPTNWRGWTVIVVYVAGVLAAGLVASRSLIAYFSIVAALTAVLFFICARTTRGGWRWRWGDKE